MAKKKEHIEPQEQKPENNVVKFTLEFEEIRARHVRRSDFDEVQIEKKIYTESIKNIERIEIVRYMESVKGISKTDVTIYGKLK